MKIRLIITIIYLRKNTLIIDKREILFRGQKVNNTDWVYGDLIHGVGEKSGKLYILPLIKFYPTGCNSLDGWEIKPESVGQFTGEVDVNKTNIFQGDIVSMDDEFEDPEISEVIYEKGGFSVEGNFGEYDVTTIGWAIEMMYEIKVIGNIYDNPELLK